MREDRCLTPMTSGTFHLKEFTNVSLLTGLGKLQAEKSHRFAPRLRIPRHPEPPAHQHPDTLSRRILTGSLSAATQVFIVGRKPVPPSISSRPCASIRPSARSEKCYAPSRSRIASPKVGSPISACHLSTCIWLVTSVERLA